jgi:hypothetical protein
MTQALRAIAIAAISSAIAVLLHAWSQPYGLFLALLIITVMMQSVRSISRNRLPVVLAALTWIAIAWVASNARNGDEILVEGDTIGSSFLIGASAFVALAVMTKKR